MQTVDNRGWEEQFRERQVRALEAIAASLAKLTARPVDYARDPQPPPVVEARWMLTGCGCVANAEQTQILRPCQWHDDWGRATYGLKLLGPRKPSGVMIGANDEPAPR